MDNATAEYAFVTTFFGSTASNTSTGSQEHNAISSPTSLLSPDNGDSVDQSKTGSDFGGYPENEVDIPKEVEKGLQRAVTTASQANSDAIWKQILDPVLEYCQVR